MSYLNRTLERKFLKMNAAFKAVLVTGARQVGKTTMLKHLAEGQQRTYVSMDDANTRDLAVNDPVLFFQRYAPPIIIDEIQKAPELFEQIKIICDGTNERGLFWLTGSERFGMMENVRESLAGRIGILELYPMSYAEKRGIQWPNELDFSMPCFIERQRIAQPNNLNDIFETIWRGGMPDVIEADSEIREEYYNSYIETYLLRDVAEIGGVTDAMKFRRFLKACAALTSEMVNYKKLGEAADVSQPTAKEWLCHLEAMGIIYLLPVFSNNDLKRLVKTPKLYFCDTGLCAYLSRWLTKDALMDGAASGHYFENFVVMELVKSYAYAPFKANLTYYRDFDKKEIDVLIESQDTLHAIEIKKTASPDRREIKKYQLLDKTSLTLGPGGIVCMCEDVLPIDSMNCYIPCNLV